MRPAARRSDAECRPKFICRDVDLRVDAADTVFTCSYVDGQIIRIPIAHNEGNYFADEDTLNRLDGDNRIVRYCTPKGGHCTGQPERRGPQYCRDPERKTQRAGHDAASGAPGRRLGRHRRPAMFDGLVELGSGGMSGIAGDRCRTRATPDEYERVLAIIDRDNLTELGIFSACGRNTVPQVVEILAQEAADERLVICGPGENAGVIDIGDGKACIFKMESHNHPSFIEPYQGAGTGVGVSCATSLRWAHAPSPT